MDSVSDVPLMTIRKITRRPQTEIVLDFGGVDRHYDLRILVDPASRDSHGLDGIVIPCASFQVGGLIDDGDTETAGEARVWRSFNEAELRAIAKACLTAAAALGRALAVNRRRGIK